MNIKVLLFGALVDATGRNQIDVDNVLDVDSLKSKLHVDFPKLNNYKYVVAIYKQIVSGNAKLNNGDTIALLPPFAGG